MFFIKRFLSEKREWIDKYVEMAKKTKPLKRQTYQDGDEFMYLGKLYPLRFGRTQSITVTDTINIPSAIAFRVRKELADWYLGQAKTIITERVTHYSKVMNVEFVSIKFSDTSSKWGSCTHDNRLQFNWRLIMAPVLIIDYVVVHELAHTLHKNHSRKFWLEVARYKPAYKQYIKWLRDNARTLHTVL